jgi:hypothetical protein
MSPEVAHRVISRRRKNLVAFGAKGTFSEARLPNRIYEYAPQSVMTFLRIVIPLYLIAEA